MSDRIRILFLAANPRGSSQLRLDEEIREIQDRIRAAAFRDAFDLVSRWAVRPKDLLQAINEANPHIVHISAHGTPTTELILEDESGAAKPVAAAALAALFKTVRGEIRLVVLNACHSEAQAKAISQEIDCTVGMNSVIGDAAAITFAASFYGALAFGRSVSHGFEQGRVALMLEGIPEENTPILLCYPGVDAARVSFLKRKAVNPVVPPLALEILTGAARSNSQIHFVRHDHGIVVVAGSARFDSSGDQRRAALLEDAVNALVQVNWLKQVDEESFSVTRAGFEAADQERDSSFSSLAATMPKLISEMKQDLEREDGRFVREFFVLETRGNLIGGSDKPRFIYYEEEHENLRGQLDILENHGLLVDVTPGNCPIYRMTEDLVRLVLRWG